MKDLFSTQASVYAKFRPVYPQELYDFLYAQVPGFDHAWDCGTGNGQVARELAKKFRQVTATDISVAQLQHAPKAANITYQHSAETLPGIPANTFDLITVATAIHWFDFDTFYAEVIRTAKPGGVIAVWCYHLMRVNPEIDAIMDRFSSGTMGPYWDKERKWVDEWYRTLPFPFTEIPAPTLSIHAEWSIEQLEGYLNSWSSVQHYIRAHNQNPVDTLLREMQPHWHDTMSVEFPLAIRIGMVK